ncbi:hypothetical protein LMG33818_000635 [Halomonadaceae bacterium LMG 33818]
MLEEGSMGDFVRDGISAGVIGGIGATGMCLGRIFTSTGFAKRVRSQS